MTYIGLKNNYHHYTTDYHRKYVLPLLNDIYKFGYNENDFVIKKNIIKDINEITNKQDSYDLSYLLPKKDKIFKVSSLEFDIDYISDFSGLMCNKNTKKLLSFTKYHELYCLPHSCSIVENLSKSNGKTLLILGDSQMIPSLPILCWYYKKVIYLDNRTTDKFYYESHLKNLKADDYLVEMFNSGLDYYYSNFR
jgi:hypothetical protein